MEDTSAKYAHYLRVSSQKQGVDGLGIEAQRSAVSKWIPAIEFVEQESGKKSDRPKLKEALAYCKKNKATLVVAKLDRLSRSCAFLSALIESNVSFICADMPEATASMLQFMSVLAEYEAKAVSIRTKAALAEARKRGTVYCNKRQRMTLPQGVTMNEERQRKGHKMQSLAADRKAAGIVPIIQGLLAGGMSLRKIAEQLNSVNSPTPRGKQWTAQAVKNALARGNNQEKTLLVY